MIGRGKWWCDAGLTFLSKMNFGQVKQVVTGIEKELWGVGAVAP